ncbi:YiiD C-terminal domain-containing protein [Pontiella sp.]|uniref:YiiD C-terminal domain-containing protein n=1 Tax=Pontiella sp. TaxID=2837462 RepID=UPI0035637675
MTVDPFIHIPPAKALGIQLNRFEEGTAELVAPFAKNVNDKGTAFAGSICSMLSLAGWAAITLALREKGIEADVLIVKSEIDYTAAARAALFAEASVRPDKIARALRELAGRGRSRIDLHAKLHSDGIDCAAMAASYAIIRTG